MDPKSLLTTSNLTFSNSKTLNTGKIGTSDDVNNLGLSTQDSTSSKGTKDDKKFNFLSNKDDSDREDNIL